MPAADGHVIVKTAADNSQLEKDLTSAAKQVEKLEKNIRETNAKRSPVAEQLRAARDEAIETYSRVERLKRALAESQAVTSAGRGSVAPDRYIEELERQKQIRAELKEQEKLLRQKEAEAEKLERRDAALVSRLEEQTAELERQRTAAGTIQEQLNRAQRMRPVSSMIEGVEKRLDKLGKRIVGLAKRVFIFTLITTALRGVRDWMGRVIQNDDEAAASLARLKGAALTLAQPLVSVVIPALTAFVNILTRIITAVAGLLSMLSGKTINQSKNAAQALNKETEALEGVGSAAEDAEGSLAGFDEINAINTESASGGAASSSSPDFSFDTSAMEVDLEKLLKWIELIGVALLAWKLSDGFFDGMRIFAGLILAINGAIELAKGAWDAWQNGAGWDNLLQMLEGAALLTGGLWLVFGKLGGAIGLIVSGLVLLTTGFHDAMENGWSLQNVLLSIAGIMATGIGIALLTGSFIPALIAAVASLLLALTIATGHGEELIEGIRQVCQGFVEFITGIFSGDLEKALGGAEKLFDGLGTVVGAVVDGIKDSILTFLDWLDQKTGGKFHSIIEVAKGLVTAFFDGVKNIALDFIGALKLIFTGLIQFISGVFTNDWNAAWEGVENIFKGIWNGIISLLEGAVNLIIKGINWIITQANKLSVKIPDLFGGGTIGINIKTMPSLQIPRLASGAVIPPNREFMAVLGDQRSGNNIEAPESLIRKIVREEAGANSETLELLQAILEAIKAGHVIMVGKTALGRTAAEAINDLTIATGKPVLKF